MNRFRMTTKTGETALRSSVREPHSVATESRGREALGIGRKAEGATSIIFQSVDSRGGSRSGEAALAGGSGVASFLL
jgi:hypothetical protein